MRAQTKRVLVSIVLLAACLSMATTASALSLQVRGGTASGDTGDGSNLGLDLFFYEGRSFDFYIGYDMISTTDRHDLVVNASTTFSATTDATTTGFTLGFRYKMQTEGSWKPFVAFGFTFLNTQFSHQPGLESYYERPFEQSSNGIRLGLGIDFGISDHLSLGLEGSMLSDIPYYEDYMFGGGRNLESYGVVSQLNLGLRYHFE